MRAQQTVGGLTVRVTAGNNVVLLGFHLTPPAVTGLLGFGIQRTDHTEGEQSWLPNHQGFPGADTGTALRTDVHPVQTFRWGDYTAKPDHCYTYHVVALTGSPGTVAQAVGDLGGDFVADVADEQGDGEPGDGVAPRAGPARP